MKTLPLRGKRVLVVGLARSGLSAVRLLVSHGAVVRVTDVKSAEQLSSVLSDLPSGVEATLGQHLLEDFLSAQLVVLSPGVPFDLEPVREARGRGIPVWPEIELAFRFMRAPLIGVTGSNGKTTTTTLLGKMFETCGHPVAVAGNIGTPLCEIAARDLSDRWTVVAELSSFQLEAIDHFRAGIAVILNITPDHLDRHQSLQSYMDAKARILENQRPDDSVVLNEDDVLSRSLATRARGRILRFSRGPLETGVCVEEGNISIKFEARTLPLMPAQAIGLRGNHNLENALAALAAAFASGLPLEPVRQAIEDFKGVEHRLEWVAEYDGVAYYNDSKATNVDAARKALEAFPGPLLVIMGGRDKGGAFGELAGLVKERVRRLMVMGEAAEKIAGALGKETQTIHVSDMEEAVFLAGKAARQGDTVLLAPACASFDMFENYEHRGRVFKDSVARFIALRGKAG